MWRTIGIGVAIGLFVASFPFFIAPTQAQNGRQKEAELTEEEKEAQAAMAAVMSDKRLLNIHREFVTRAEKLALEYEKDKDWDKAKTVWGEILKIAPQYGPARAKMQQLLEREANADVVRMDVRADEGWQNTGVVVVPGKPVRVRAAGYWTFGLKMKLSPDGIQIPEELREYNLGCLIGVIDTGDENDLKPFVIGADKSLDPAKPGRLMLRMYDISPEDNEGALQVEIRGTFQSE